MNLYFVQVLLQQRQSLCELLISEGEGVIFLLSLSQQLIS